ncbi:hypothetical protein [Methanoplanus endosymbiosus]|uniref:Uncharacterized protein n=1 Tax=Methanoplanus endosymbiosus TaxID=33865 RepID=A0A9E7TML1_9EURY|nr:hypothetical protein [Methanoplanus endosymbiosus]UUX93391.1 hypothetical protein L6E24_04495 [Methanoplanus endosymbiosus]
MDVILQQQELYKEVSGDVTEREINSEKYMQGKEIIIIPVWKYMLYPELYP